jgi:hypothetical protein
MIILVAFSLFLEYLFSIAFFNFYNFHDNYLEIYYPTRIGKWKRRHINYSDIEFVKYFGDSWSDPIIRIYKFNKQRNIHGPGNSFNAYYFKKAQTTLKFLQSKGIPIEIKTENEKKKRILE